MAGATSLENALASLQGAAWRGRIYRVMLNDYPPDRENIQGASATSLPSRLHSSVQPYPLISDYRGTCQKT